jgi:hypothetical protein
VLGHASDRTQAPFAPPDIPLVPLRDLAVSQPGKSDI